MIKKRFLQMGSIHQRHAAESLHLIVEDLNDLSEALMAG